MQTKPTKKKMMMKAKKRKRLLRQRRQGSNLPHQPELLIQPNTTWKPRLVFE